MPKSYRRYAASTPGRFHVTNHGDESSDPSRFAIPRLELEVTHQPEELAYKPKYHDQSYRPRDHVETPLHFHAPSPRRKVVHPHESRYVPPPNSDPYRAPHHGITRTSAHGVYMPKYNDAIFKPDPAQGQGHRGYLETPRTRHCNCRRHNHHHHHHNHNHYNHNNHKNLPLHHHQRLREQWNDKTPRHKPPPPQYPGRAATYGMDKSYNRQYRHVADDDDDYDGDDYGGDDDCGSVGCSTCSECYGGVGGRVHLYTHDSHDPFSCSCFPRKSSKNIPAMMYDGVRCPHPDHLYPPAKQDVFAYPWTVQSNRPYRQLEYGYKQGQVKPPSAVTAPPFTLYHNQQQHPAALPGPHTAPIRPVAGPNRLLSTDPSDRRLRRADRQRLAALSEDTVDGDEEISPFDSISQVSPARSYRGGGGRPPSLRLRTVDSPMLRRFNSEVGRASAHQALSTPHARPLLDADGFPQTPTRMFKGEYVDPNSGNVHEYDIKYGRQALGGSRTMRTM